MSAYGMNIPEKVNQLSGPPATLSQHRNAMVKTVQKKRGSTDSGHVRNATDIYIN